MAIQSQIFQLSGNLVRTFPTTKHIPQKQNMAVWLGEDDGTGNITWSLLEQGNYDLINNAAVVRDNVDLSAYSFLEVRVADEQGELPNNPTDISTIAPYVTEIKIVADNIEGVLDVSANMLHITTVSTNIADVNTTASNIQSVNTTASAIQSINTVAANITDVNTVAANIGDINIVADNIQSVLDAYKNSRVAEAERMTSDSYATEPEDVYVKEYYYDEAIDSILYNDTTEFSSFHYSKKASYVASGLTYMGTWDSVDCSMPPAPTALDVQTYSTKSDANGFFYIVTSVSGDTTSCPNLSVGDWIVWEGDDPTTDPVEGGWRVVDWTFDWSAIVNVPDNVQNAVTQVEVDAGDATIQANLDTHASDTSNPHSVTASQVGAATQADIDRAMPIGAIIMWSGDTVPTGWAICDGNNGTPNLTDRFIYSVPLSGVGATGGSNDAIVVSHTHTASASSTSTVTDPGHAHTYTYLNPAGTADGGNANLVNGTQEGTTAGATTGITVATSTSVTIDSTGEDGTNKNMPRYYTLAFIMRIS